MVQYMVYGPLQLKHEVLYHLSYSHACSRFFLCLVKLSFKNLCSLLSTVQYICVVPYYCMITKLLPTVYIEMLYILQYHIMLCLHCHEIYCWYWLMSNKVNFNNSVKGTNNIKWNLLHIYLTIISHGVSEHLNLSYFKG